MAEKKQTDYERLSEINVSEHIEKKGNLSYLSWVWAIDTLLRNDPEAEWDFDEPLFYNDTVMVRCWVTAFGKTRKMFLPVMDYRNKAITNPDSFAINTAMMRCLVKCIALFGIGLYIYAGEDLPVKPDADTLPPPGESLPKPTAKRPAATKPHGVPAELEDKLAKKGVKGKRKENFGKWVRETKQVTASYLNNNFDKCFTEFEEYEQNKMKAEDVDLPDGADLFN